MVAKVATGEVEEELEGDREVIPEKSKAGRKGGKARVESLAPEYRPKIASDAARARWGK